MNGIGLIRIGSYWRYDNKYRSYEARNERRQPMEEAHGKGVLRPWRLLTVKTQKEIETAPIIGPSGDIVIYGSEMPVRMGKSVRLIEITFSTRSSIIILGNKAH